MSLSRAFREESETKTWHGEHRRAACANTKESEREPRARSKKSEAIGEEEFVYPLVIAIGHFRAVIAVQSCHVGNSLFAHLWANLYTSIRTREL